MWRVCIYLYVNNVKLIILENKDVGLTMSKINFIKRLALELTNILPENLGTLKKDFEKNCASLLSKTFTKFDVVSREEFDAQSKVLLRTRKKLEALEEQIEALESLIKHSHKAHH